MQKHYIVTLTPEEREQLEIITTKGNNKARTIKHANMLLKADQGDNRPSWSDTEIATAFNAGRATIERLRKRFVEEGLESALKPIKESNNRAPRKLDGYQEAQLVTLACSKPPEGHCQWTLRLLADKLIELEVVDTISYETVRRTLKKTKLNLG